MEGSKGRDKFGKIIQYGSRALKYYLLLDDPKSDWGQRFDGLYSTTATARKLWRLLKSLNEFESLYKLFTQKDLGDPVVYYLQVLQKTSYAAYWAFDNVGYLIRAKFLKLDKKEYSIYAAYGWFVGSVAYLLIASYELYKLNGKMAKKSREYKQAKQDGKDLAELKKGLVELYKKRVRLVSDVVRFWCDVIVSGQTADIFQQLFGYSVHDGHMGILGVISAVLNSQQIWQETK